MKKVMFYHPSYYLGGTEIAILSLAKQLKNVEIYIGYSMEDSDEGVLQRYRDCNAKVVNIRKDKNIEVDTLVICSPYIGIYDECEKISRSSTYLWLHYTGDFTNRILESDEYINKIDKVIAVSDNSKDIILRRYNKVLIQDKLEVIYNVVDAKEILDKSEEEQQIDIKLAKDLNIVSVSRLCKEKGFARKLKLAEILKAKGIDFKWFVIGSNSSNEEEAGIMAEFDKYRENFEFLGYIQNPYPVIKKCDYLALLSDEETWGLVVTEAKILKVPCLVTDFEVIFEQVTNKENGIIISRDSSEKYGKNVDDLIKYKNELKENMPDMEYENSEILEKWIEII